jgi:NAD(P)-dependent dehydrogenase (short-subunit alcohol dehydrogenase family)
MSLTSDTRVVILGGTSGIGLAVAHAAAARGAQIVVGSSRQSTVDTALASLPAGVTGLTVDAGSSESLAAFLDAAGDIDHFVYTAGENLIPLPLADYTQEQGATFLHLRVVAAIDAVRLAVPHMRLGSSIILTSGSAAFRGGAGWTVGAATAGAVMSLSRSLAIELAPIRVNAVAPGVARSPLWAKLPSDAQQDMYEAVAAASPLGRVIEAEDVAQVYVGLMEQEMVTGTVSVVDGGGLLV